MDWNLGSELGHHRSCGAVEVGGPRTGVCKLGMPPALSLKLCRDAATPVRLCTVCGTFVLQQGGSCDRGRGPQRPSTSSLAIEGSLWRLGLGAGDEAGQVNWG